jgi:hypothetical protein
LFEQVATKEKFDSDVVILAIAALTGDEALKRQALNIVFLLDKELINAIDEDICPGALTR